MSDLPTLPTLHIREPIITDDGRAYGLSSGPFPGSVAYVPASRLAAVESERDAANERAEKAEADLARVTQERDDFAKGAFNLADEAEQSKDCGESQGENCCGECIACRDVTLADTASKLAATREREQALVALLKDARHCIEEDRDARCSGYGAFPGGDPRDFRPDPECSTDAEREAHRLACEKWDRGEGESLPGAHQWLTPEEAQKALGSGDADSAMIGPGLAHVSFNMFGLGSYTYPDPATDDLLARIDAATGEK